MFQLAEMAGAGAGWPVIRRKTRTLRPTPRLLPALLAAASISAQAQTAPAPQRLSDWLLQDAAAARPNAYPLGLSWRVPGEVPAQQSLKFELLQALSGKGEGHVANPAAMERMRAWLDGLPVTGRVPVALADARWLQARSDRDPVLMPGHAVIMPERPVTVTVLANDGNRCAVTHTAGGNLMSYLLACDQAAASRGDWVWLVQPDGRIQRFGIALWNLQEPDEAAPGAWIWAPARDAGWSEEFSVKLVSFLATQGPAADPSSQTRQSPAPVPVLSNLLQGDPAGRATYGDFGDVGVLQTASARMRPPGSFGFTVSRTTPYTRINVALQPFDWMEAAFRYTNISNRQYDPAGIISATQTYKDKSIDLKLRLAEESFLMPQVAVGIRDLTGTGLFSGEYLVANKRTGPIDWSLGVGWGYTGARGNLRNPLRFLGRKETRAAPVVGQGGSLSPGTYFSGPASLFAGAQLQSPWEDLILKLEYDGNSYQNEAMANNQVQKSPWNVGAVYRLSRGVDLSIGFERGNRFMLGLSLHADLANLYMPKPQDPPVIPVVEARPATGPDWSRTLRTLEAQTDWRVRRIAQAGRDLRVEVSDSEGFYWRRLADRAAAVLHRDAPPDVDRFTIVHRERGMEVAEHVIDRDSWVTQQTRPLPPQEARQALIARAPLAAPATARTTIDNPRPAFEHGLGIAYQQVLGGPDGFILFQLAAIERAKLRFSENTWVQGTVQLALLNNFDKFKYTAPSNLPRVRTYMREFMTSSPVTVPNLQATHVGKLGDNQYYSVYGGYLESMYAGVGGEWLYRPFASRLALGVDVNAVQQRDFKQNFALRDYRVLTGHMSAYWDTGWKDVQATVNVGRYLARDMGVTVNLARTFENGVKIGAFATKTNVSSATFGEGSFDKGIYISIPFDALLTRTSGNVAGFTWRPLTRDGGAMLYRDVTLNELTKLRDRRATQYTPATPPNETVIPADRRENWIAPRAEPAPVTREEPRPTTAQWNAAPARFEWNVMEALARQGFQNVQISLDSAWRVNVVAANDEIRPASRAAGRIARTVLNLAPLDAREIHITLHEDGGPAAEYDLLDLKRLEGYLNGTLNREAFAASMTVAYPNPNARVADPLLGFADISTGPRYERPVADVLLPRMGTIQRVREDFLAAGREAARVDWLKAGAVGAGLVLLSSTLDRRADRFALNHNQGPAARGLISAGNALPWLALGGATLFALDNGNPGRSRTGYAALEAGATGFLAATALKMAVGRARPVVSATNDFKPFSQMPGHDSFPSRHAIVAWAVATPFAEEWNAPWLYGVAGLTNLARVGSREHWFSDTVAGSLMGYGIGRLFYDSGRAATKSGPQVLLSPRSVQLQWKLP